MDSLIELSSNTTLVFKTHLHHRIHQIILISPSDADQPSVCSFLPVFLWWFCSLFARFFEVSDAVFPTGSSPLSEFLAVCILAFVSVRQGSLAPRSGGLEPTCPTMHSDFASDIGAVVISRYPGLASTHCGPRGFRNKQCYCFCVIHPANGGFTIVEWDEAAVKFGVSVLCVPSVWTSRQGQG